MLKMKIVINLVLAVYIMLFWIFFTINVSGIGAYFVYYKYVNRNKENVSKYDYIYQTTI